MRIAAPSPNAAPPSSPASSTLTVAQFNVENLFPPGDNSGGTAPTEQAYGIKLTKLAHAILDELHTPDVITLEEVGSPTALADLMSRTGLGAAGYKWAEMPTNDLRHIDVAVLYRADRVHLDGTHQLTPELPAGMPQPRGAIDPTRLFSRPPLVADFSLTGAGQAQDGARQIEFVVNHLMAKVGGPQTEQFRLAQAKYLAGFVDAQRAAQPNRGVVVVGDLNTDYGEQPYETLTTAADGSSRMADTPVLGLPLRDRYTYVFKGHPDMLDHMLVTPDLAKNVTSVVIPHFDTADQRPGKQGPTHRDDPTSASGVSDHDPILTTFSFPATK